MYVSSPTFGAYRVCALDDSADEAVDTKSPFFQAKAFALSCRETKKETKKNVFPFYTILFEVGLM